jgi:hypothetical protein
VFCNGDFQPGANCAVRVFVGACPYIYCPEYHEDAMASQFIPHSTCLHVTRGFHMAFLQASCIDTHHNIQANIGSCLNIADNRGMGKFLQVYSSTAGIILSTVPKKHWDPRHPYTNAPSTSDECSRIIPIR